MIHSCHTSLIPFTMSGLVEKQNVEKELNEKKVTAKTAVDAKENGAEEVRLHQNIKHNLMTITLHTVC